MWGPLRDNPSPCAHVWAIASKLGGRFCSALSRPVCNQILQFFFDPNFPKVGAHIDRDRRSTVHRVGILARNSKIQKILRPSAAITGGTLIYLRLLRGRGSFYPVLVRTNRVAGVDVASYIQGLARGGLYRVTQKKCPKISYFKRM